MDLLLSGKYVGGVYNPLLLIGGSISGWNYLWAELLVLKNKFLFWGGVFNTYNYYGRGKKVGGSITEWRKYRRVYKWVGLFIGVRKS